MSVVSKRHTAAAAYAAGTPVYASAAGVATSTDLGYRDNQLGVLVASVASGGECQIARSGQELVITGTAANVGEWAVAVGGKVSAFTSAELGSLTAQRAHTILGQFASNASAADELALVDLNMSTIYVEGA